MRKAELEITYKELVVTQTQDLLGGNDKHHKELQS
jgi:hypothetical protein